MAHRRLQLFAMSTLLVTRALLRTRLPGHVPTRSIMTLKDHKVYALLIVLVVAQSIAICAYMQYTAHATARGQGRNGEVRSDDDSGLKLRLAMPRSLGGKGDGQNPEQLFAMGYAGAYMPSGFVGTC